MANRTQPPELVNAPREVFIFALTILSLVNIVLALPFSPLTSAQRQVIMIIDGVLTVFFLLDFGTRMRQATSKSRYFFHERGWLDLLGSLPGLRVLRVFRLIRAWRLMHEYGLRGNPGVADARPGPERAVRHDVPGDLGPREHGDRGALL